jgi:structure-specific recognition protein 1
MSSPTTNNGAASAEMTEYDEIYYGPYKGKLSIGTEITWNPTTSKPDLRKTVPINKIKKLEWKNSTRGSQLRIYKSKSVLQFDGFKRTDFEHVNAFCERVLHMSIDQLPTSLVGMNWGDLAVNPDGTHLTIRSNLSDHHELFDIPLDLVKNCTKQPKSKELVVEFNVDDLMSKNDDCLVGIRFALPKEASTDGNDALDTIHASIMKTAAASTETGKAIATFQSLPFVSPRGKYSVDLFKKDMRLHGKTYDFKIPYHEIITMFLLPKPTGTSMYFVINLRSPIRTGNTPHQNLVFEFDKNQSFPKDSPLKLNLSPDELKKYSDKQIGEQMSGKVFEVVAKVFRALTEKKLIGAGNFTSSEGQKGIKCAHKANEGFLFFLEKSLFFLHKPPIYMHHEDIRTVKLQRVERAGGSRYFDFAIVMKKDGKTITFSNINKNEKDIILRYLQDKGLNIENVGQLEEEKQAAVPLMDDEDEEDDEDFVAEKDDDEEDDREFDEFVADENAASEVNESDIINEKKRKRVSTGSEDASPPKKKKKPSSE